MVQSLFQYALKDIDLYNVNNILDRVTLCEFNLLLPSDIHRVNMDICTANFPECDVKLNFCLLHAAGVNLA